MLCRYFIAVLLCCFIFHSSAHADYTLSPLSGGSASKTVQKGDSFSLDLVLTSDGSDEHNSAIFRVVFSSGGLSYESYAWTAPYATGTTDDDSKPLIADLPTVLTADTLSGPGYPAGTVDIELSNVLASATFGTGTLATMTITVPASYSGSNSVTISVAPDTFADGFTEINTIAGPSFKLTTVDPCAGDPCCGSSDPCCGSSNPCCGSPDPCCGSPDPCCGKNDSDTDGVCDDVDTCPDTTLGEQVDTNGCSCSQLDTDNDGVIDCDDSCPDTTSGETVDTNGCAITDCNNNGISDAADITSGTSKDCDSNGTPDECQSDLDTDGVPDSCDNCELAYNPDQADSDGDGIGDFCDTDDGDPTPDRDGDGIIDDFDNCIDDVNPDQADADGDGAGDICDRCPHNPRLVAPRFCGCGMAGGAVVSIVGLTFMQLRRKLYPSRL